MTGKRKARLGRNTVDREQLRRARQASASAPRHRQRTTDTTGDTAMSGTRTRGRTNTGPHKTLRKRLLADLARRPGQPCARCGQPMYVTQLLDLDHTDDRTGYLGLSHRACNRRDGQRKTTAILKAKGWTPSRRQWQAIAYRQQQQRGASARQW